uniref:UPF0380 proteins YafZ and homologs n=1 Tax=Klebsiella pneumoniae TaxID=573 RepID=A0A8B0SSZ6_KLEPN|nr:UPF0380 proteins YafZ and homologs [Klebsiella pneumoniae]
MLVYALAANGSQTGEGYIRGAGSAGPRKTSKTAAPATQRVMVLKRQKQRIKEIHHGSTWR